MTATTTTLRATIQAALSTGTFTAYRSAVAAARLGGVDRNDGKSMRQGLERFLGTLPDAPVDAQKPATPPAPRPAAKPAPQRDPAAKDGPQAPAPVPTPMVPIEDQGEPMPAARMAELKAAISAIGVALTHAAKAGLLPDHETVKGLDRIRSVWTARVQSAEKANAAAKQAADLAAEAARRQEEAKAQADAQLQARNQKTAQETARPTAPAPASKPEAQGSAKPTCEGTTAAGKPCRNAPVPGTKHCRHHAGQETLPATQAAQKPATAEPTAKPAADPIAEMARMLGIPAQDLLAAADLAGLKLVPVGK